MFALLRKNADLRWLFIAQVVSFMGDWFTFVAVAAIVKEATDSAFLVSLAYVSFSLPAFLASPVAGPVVDRFDRRKLLLVVSAAQAVAALGLLLSDSHTVWPLFVFQGTISALAAFIKPAIDAGVPNLARDADELRTANALFGSTWGVMLAVGAAVGGVFSQAFGRDAAFIADAVSFVIALGLFALVRRPMQEPGHSHRRAMRPLADMGEAFHYAKQDHVVLALIASKSTFGIGSSVVSQLPVLATGVYHWKDGGIGLLLAGRGVGAGLGPVLGQKLTKGNLPKVLKLCGYSGLMFGLCYAAGAWSPTIFLAAVMISLGHLGGGAQWTLSTYGLQMRTPDHIRGRVMAGDYAFVTLVMSVFGMLAGFTSEHVDVRWTMTIFAGAVTVAALPYIVVTRRLISRLESETLTPAAG